jgi:hypothetical protein
MCATPAAARRAKAICRKLESLIAEAIDRNDPSVQGLTFNDIEANSAAAGDAISRMLMVEALLSQPSPTQQEEAEARQEVLGKADTCAAPTKTAEKLKMTRQKRKRKRLKTIRGEIEFDRGYLYFPELGRGIFPPRQTPGAS